MIMNECLYSTGIISLVEDGHVNNECDGLAKHIASEIKQKLKQVSPVNFRAFIDNCDWFYSGYSVNPYYIEEMKHSTDDVSIEMFKEDDEDSATYLLYYTLFYEPSEREKAGCNMRAIVQDAVNVIVNKQDVQVEINIAKFKNMEDDLNYLSMMATIAHELQHIFDQYIISDRVFIEDDKNNVYYDFHDDNVFNISPVSDDYKIMDTLLYVMSHSEQRGFLSELRTLLTGISKNTELKNQLFVDSIHNNYNLQGYPLIVDRTDFTEDMLIEHIYKHPLIKNVSRAYSKDVVYEKLNYILDTDKNHYNYLMLMVGYYMFRHGMLRLPKYKVKEADAGHLFSYDYISVNTDSSRSCLNDIPEKFIKTVEYSMDYELQRYIREIKAEIKKHLHNIFNYKEFGNYMNEMNCSDYGLTPEQWEMLEMDKQIILYD